MTSPEAANFTHLRGAAHYCTEKNAPPSGLTVDFLAIPPLTPSPCIADQIATASLEGTTSPSEGIR